MEFKELQELLEKEIKKCEGIIKDGLDKQAKGLEGSAQTISQIKDAMGKAEEKLLALETEKKSMETRLSEMEVKSKRPGFGGGDKITLATPGQQFILSDQYQGARNKKAYEADTFEVGSMFEKKQIAGATRGDLTADRAPVFADRDNEIIFEPGQREMRLFDLMARTPTSSNSIEYFREVIDTTYPGAGEQTEETAEKNQASVNFEKETAIVETIGTWIAASRQVMEDAPRLQSYIDGRLTYAIMAEAENQLLYGSGAAGQLLGIINTPGVQTITAAAGDTVLDTIRKAIAMVRVNEYPATGIVLHPNDWAVLELIKGSDGHYVWVQVPNGGEMRLWRVPVVESTVITEGQFLVGSFGLGAKLYDRMAATIRVSEHHEDFFIRNAICILAELRLALETVRPSAFVKGSTGTASS